MESETPESLPGTVAALGERLGLTAERLPTLLRETEAGTPLQPPSIHFQLSKGQAQLPLAAFLLAEPAGGWEDTQRANVERYLAGLPPALNEFLAQATPATPLPLRLAALQHYLGEQGAALRRRLAELEPA